MLFVSPPDSFDPMVLVGFQARNPASTFCGDPREFVLPFPPWLTESHDLWIGLAGNVTREMRHLEDPSVERRLHGSNQTPLGWRSLPTILRARVMLARCLVEARRRSLH